MLKHYATAKSPSTVVDADERSSSVSSATLESPTVDCDAVLLNQIRIAVVEGLHKIPHGGLEIGGVLIGTKTDNRVRLEEWRPIAASDGIFDEASEPFNADVSTIIPTGAVNAAVRAFDSAGNAVVRTIPSQ